MSGKPRGFRARRRLTAALAPGLLLLPLNAACGTLRGENAAAAAAPAAAAVRPAVPLAAIPFGPADVRVTGGPFRRALDENRVYLLKLDPDRLLAHLRENAGLKPKAAPYGGWDKGGAGMIGHYLSACALSAAATGDPALKRRVEYVVSEMAACQKAGGDGGLYAFGWDKNTYFARLKRGEVTPVAVSAWYVTHKILAGLRDAYVQCGNTQAREVLVRMCDWCGDVTAKLTDAQWQQMLDGEHGAPHEILADVYAFTGDRKYLALAEKFRHEKVFAPLASGDDAVLDGLHANTQIPKFVGYERIYELTGDAPWHEAASRFWDAVADGRSWANGSNSQWEHFFPASESGRKVTEVCGPETCNSYNMLKLTRQLWSLAPSAKYVDYYENALYNSILPSLDPDHGGYVYYTSMRPGHYRVFSRDFDAFWCCVGTGMENPGRYGAMVYARSAESDRLYVNLYLPTRLTWAAKGLTLTQETRFPEEPRTTLAFSLAKPERLTLCLRQPSWAAGPLTVTVNGAPVSADRTPEGYMAVTRVWKTGDRVTTALPMRLSAEPLPDAPDYVAFRYGPALLAGALGASGLTPADFRGGGADPGGMGQLARRALPSYAVPALIGDTTKEALLSHISTDTTGPPLRFRLSGLTVPGSVSLVPFYRLFDQRYALYWHVVSPSGAEALARWRADAEGQDVHLDTRTVDEVHPGDPSSERSHSLASDRSSSGPMTAVPELSHWRDATGWFRYEMAAPAGGPVAIRCTYFGSDTNRIFDILVDGEKIATERLEGSHPGDFYSVTYPVPPALTRGKERLSIEFRAAPGSTAGGVFDLRTVRPAA